VGNVEQQHVHFLARSACARSRKSPVAPTAAPTRSRPRSSFVECGFCLYSLKVAHGDEAADAPLLVQEGQLLDPVLEHGALGLLERHRGGRVTRRWRGGHEVRDGPRVGGGVEGHVAVREDAGEAGRSPSPPR